jgi:hypothetical protein
MENNRNSQYEYSVIELKVNDWPKRKREYLENNYIFLDDGSSRPGKTGPNRLAMHSITKSRFIIKEISP